MLLASTGTSSELGVTRERRINVVTALSQAVSISIRLIVTACTRPAGSAVAPASPSQYPLQRVSATTADATPGGRRSGRKKAGSATSVDGITRAEDRRSGIRQS